jgi:hypothetical protein
LNRLPFQIPASLQFQNPQKHQPKQETHIHALSSAISFTVDSQHVCDVADGDLQGRNIDMTNKLALIVGLMSCASLLHAAPITLQFTGIVTQVPIDDIYGDIAAGNLFNGSFTFESTATDLIPADPATASYLSSGVPYSMTVSLAGHTFTAADSVSIGVFNSFLDQYTVLALGSGAGVTLELFLQDNSGTVFADDSLPLLLPLLSSLTIADFHFHEVVGGAEVQVDGQLTSFTSVPEPSTGLSIFAGALGLWAILRRTQRTNSQSSSRS